MLTAFQYFILGAIQGITEWLPISSSGILVLIMSNVFGINDVGTLLTKALILHLGTLLAVTVYFRRDVKKIIKTFSNYSHTEGKEKKVFNFLLIATLITSLVGLLILKLIGETNLQNMELTGKTITFFVGFFLFITGVIQIKIRMRGLKEENNLKLKDSLLPGFVQGLATIPGISRSGMTISSLLLQKFDDTTALKLSFLMSIPVVLIGNLVLNYNEFTFSNAALYGILASFLFGLATIHGMIKLTKKINFGWFVLCFAILMMLSIFI